MEGIDTDRWAGVAPGAAAAAAGLLCPADDTGGIAGESGSWYKLYRLISYYYIMENQGKICHLFQLTV